MSRSFCTANGYIRQSSFIIRPLIVRSICFINRAVSINTVTLVLGNTTREHGPTKTDKLIKTKTIIKIRVCCLLRKQNRRTVFAYPSLRRKTRRSFMVLWSPVRLYTRVYLKIDQFVHRTTNIFRRRFESITKKFIFMFVKSSFFKRIIIIFGCSDIRRTRCRQLQLPTGKGIVSEK